MFGLSGVESGVMTKVSADAVSEALEATSPVGPFTLRAVSKSNPLRAYDITTGVPVTMAVDAYTVTGSGAGAEIATITGGKLYATPKWSVDTEVTVSADGGSLPVEARYSCIAVVMDRSLVASVRFKNGADDVDSYPVGGTDVVGVVYASGNWTYSKPLYLYVNPSDVMNYETKLYRLVNGSYEGMLNVQNGRWYSLSPGAVETTSGTMGLTFGGWMPGE